DELIHDFVEASLMQQFMDGTLVQARPRALRCAARKDVWKRSRKVWPQQDCWRMKRIISREKQGDGFLGAHPTWADALCVPYRWHLDAEADVDNRPPALCRWSADGNDGFTPL